MEKILSSINLELLLPILLIQGVLLVIAVMDWIKNENQIRGNRWVWLVVIILGNILGPVLYFIFGKRRDA
ncbi:PLD nuclease N-terminal domain-containing protein [Oceanobacillus sp. CAU 1775]